MHRIDTPNRAIDLWGAGKPGWRDGNKALGVNPTEFNALFMNSLQEEVAGVIEGAGLVLDPGNNSQLKNAILCNSVDGAVQYRQAALLGCSVMIQI